MLVYDIIISTKYRKEAEIMSIVRYTDKKTGRVVLYESTSHYDPVTKQSRPIRKYLGVEDPVTGELIPSTGKPGRKAKSESNSNTVETKVTAEPDYKEIIKKLKEESIQKDKRISELEKQNAILKNHLLNIKESAERALEQK